jgi:hypothetical protein
MCATGVGVPQDYALAHMWFNLEASLSTDVPTRDKAIKDRDDVAATTRGPPSVALGRDLPN